MLSFKHPNLMKHTYNIHYYKYMYVCVCTQMYSLDFDLDFSPSNLMLCFF